MKIRELERDDVGDAVRILVLSFERELNFIFRDIELARGVLFKFFSNYRENCFVAEDERILGFASYSTKKMPISKHLRKELGFLQGLKVSLLIEYLCPKPKRGEGVINFIAVSPLRRNQGIGSILLKKIIEDAEGEGVKRLKVNVSVKNDTGIGLFTKFGFEIDKMLDNSFSEKNFGQRQWYVMKLDLKPKSRIS